VFASIRDHKPALAREAVLEDLEYAEGLLRKHAASGNKDKPHRGGQMKRSHASTRRQQKPRIGPGK